MKCPKCGGELTETGYAFPYPELRCRSCMARNKEMKDMQKQIDELKKIVDIIQK